MLRIRLVECMTVEGSLDEHILKVAKLKQEFTDKGYVDLELDGSEDGWDSIDLYGYREPSKEEIKAEQVTIELRKQTRRRQYEKLALEFGGK